MQGKTDNSYGSMPIQPRQLSLPIAARARPPQAPPVTPGVLTAQSERAVYVEQRENLERHSVLRGLALLALSALAFSLLRAGADRAFYAGWWRQW